MAALHYYGDAFDPEHMRAIANMAADALAGWQDGELTMLPDYEQSTAEAKEKAAKWGAELWAALDDYDTVVDDSDDVQTS
jgi:hypothetical protein